MTFASEGASTVANGSDDGRLSSTETVIVIVVALANLVPIWGFRYFPGQDTANHLYTAEILKVLLSGTAPAAVARTFVAALGVKSNIAFDLILLALGRLGVSLGVAHRLALSAYALSFPWAASWCARAAATRNRPLAMLFLPLTWNWFIVQGLYNYALSLVPALIWLGIVARDGGRPRPRAAVLLAFVSLATFFSHLGTFVGLLFLSVWRVAFGPGTTKDLRGRLTSAGPLACALGPAVLLACAPLLSSGTTHPTPLTLSAWETYDVPTAIGAFFVEFAMRYRVTDLLALGPPLLMLLAVPLYEASVRRRGCGPFKDDARLTSRWSLGAAAGLTVLYVLVPHIVLGSDASPRIRPLIVFCLLCYGGVGLSAGARRLVSTLTLACGLGSVWLLCCSFATLNTQLDDYVAAIPFVRQGATLYPMVFDPRSPSILVKPFLHAWGYYGVSRDVVTPFAFAWNRDRFPIRYREEPSGASLPFDSEDEPYALLDGRACSAARRLAPSRDCDDVRREIENRLAVLGESYDYVLTWKAPPEFSALLVSRGYRVVTSQGAMSLYAVANRSSRA